MKNKAWKVEFRTGPKQDWVTDVTFPAIDLVEIDGQHQEEPMDLGELRAQAHAAYINRAHGKAWEVKVTHCHFPAFDDRVGTEIIFKGVFDG